MDRLAKYLIIAGVTAIVLFLGWYFRTVLLYIALAVVVALIGKPVVKALTRIQIKGHHFPRWLASGLTLLIIICVCLSLFLLLAPMIGEVVHLINNLNLSTLETQIDAPLEKVNEFIIKSIPSAGQNFKIEVYLFDYLKDFINLNTFSNIIVSLASFIANFGIAIFSVVFISFFLLMENGIITDTLSSIVPDKYEEKVRRTVKSINTLLSRYFVGISLESLFVAALNSIGLIFIAKIDFQLAIVVAFASGILNIIPYLGPLIGDVLAVLMGLIYHINNGVGMPLLLFLIIILGIFIVTQFIDNYVFQPLIYSNSVKAHPLEIFIIILLAGQISGIFGILIAVPTYTVLRVIASEFLSDSKFVQKLTHNIK
ncbi:MAG TPA: AI-2E family transporter [Candidatus Coprenecus stercoravium]|uniref:AI-2E family transporter n=1 Tax=Candidatus Coprenecus stercoravium TaxID=2840735 RepID=A0A9D2GPK5_9BACT|nr:AI-2E family transporter [Candidatus Coprenecus stercoravium]